MSNAILELEAFADEAIWIIHQILPEDRYAVLSILLAYQKRAEAAAEERAAAMAASGSLRKLPTSCGRPSVGRG